MKFRACYILIISVEFSPQWIKSKLLSPIMIFSLSSTNSNIIVKIVCSSNQSLCFTNSINQISEFMLLSQTNGGFYFCKFIIICSDRSYLSKYKVDRSSTITFSININYKIVFFLFKLYHFIFSEILTLIILGENEEQRLL